MTSTLRRPEHSTPESQLATLERVVARSTQGGGRIKVLEAGCGETPSPIGVGDGALMVGIDISERQLARNSWAHEKIRGDIQTYDFPDADFDVVVSWDVLEHLPRPEQALARLARAVKPGGLLVVKIPNLFSAKGLITKLTPYSFHVWVYKHVFGYTDPGVDDRPPFPTFLRRSITPPALVRFAGAHGLAIEMFGTFEADKQTNVRRRYKVTGTPWRLICRCVKVVSRGWVEPEGTELIAVFRRT